MRWRFMYMTWFAMFLAIVSCADPPSAQETNELARFAKLFTKMRPLATAQDFYKVLYQESFGPGHIIASWEVARMGLEQEIASMPPHDEQHLVEPCGPRGRMLRLNLRTALRAGMTVDTILHMMKLCVERLEPDTLGFLTQWDEVRHLAQQNLMPWSDAEFEEVDAMLSPSGLDVIHHSSIYALNYAPAYRVILAEVFDDWRRRNGIADR